MRLLLCGLLASVLLTLSLPASADAAKRLLTLAQTQAAAEQGDAQASSALLTVTDQETCLAECNRRGFEKAQCTSSCKPGLCHPDAETPYCVR